MVKLNNFLFEGKSLRWLYLNFIFFVEKVLNNVEDKGDKHNHEEINIINSSSIYSIM